jgi:hypothetical protein
MLRIGLCRAWSHRRDALKGDDGWGARHRVCHSMERGRRRDSGRLHVRRRAKAAAAAMAGPQPAETGNANARGGRSRPAHGAACARGAAERGVAVPRRGDRSQKGPMARIMVF